ISPRTAIQRGTSCDRYSKTAKIVPPTLVTRYSTTIAASWSAVSIGPSDCEVEASVASSRNRLPIGFHCSCSQEEDKMQPVFRCWSPPVSRWPLDTSVSESSNLSSARGLGPRGTAGPPLGSDAHHVALQRWPWHDALPGRDARTAPGRWLLDRGCTRCLEYPGQPPLRTHAPGAQPAVRGRAGSAGLSLRPGPDPRRPVPPRSRGHHSCHADWTGRGLRVRAG